MAGCHDVPISVHTARLLALLVFLAAGPAAADLGERRITFGGFGTLAALYHDEDGLEYRRSVQQPRGAKAGELDLETDSLLGVQVNAAWNREIEGVSRPSPTCPRKATGRPS